MNRGLLQVVLGLIVCVLGGLLPNQVAADNEIDLFRQVARHEVYGGITQFSLSEKDYNLYGKDFAITAKGGGDVLIVRDQDIEQQKCMNDADAAWMFNVIKMIKGDGLPIDMDAAAKLVGKTKWIDIPNCNERWHDKVKKLVNTRKAHLKDVEIKGRDRAIRAKLTDILSDVSNISAKVDAVQSEMADLAALHRTLSKTLTEQLAEAQKVARVAQIQSDIDTGAQFAQLLARVAFAKNPAAAYRVQVATDGIAMIAKNVVSLSSGLQTGAKIAAGLNITNAALSMVSMLGSGGADPTASMIQSGFASIRADIHALAESMNDRFDRVEQGMSIIYTGMNNRFDKLDRQYERLVQQLNQMDQEARLHYRLSDEALASLLSQDYLASYKTCTSPGIEAILTGVTLKGCQSNFAVFVGENAKQRVLTGDVLFDPRWEPEEAAIRIDGVDDANRMGFLRSSLQNGQGRPGVSISGLTILAPSPYVWAQVVDTYVATLALGPQMKDPVSEDQFILMATNDLNDFFNQASRIAEVEKSLRTDGVKVAAEIYRVRLKEVADLLSAAANQHAASEDLSILADSDYREAIGGYTDNDHLQIVLRRGTGISVIDGPQKGERIEVKNYQERNTGPIDIRGDGKANTEAWLSQARNVWLQNDDPTQWGLNTYGPPINTSSEQVIVARIKANEQYLAAVKVSDMISEARDTVTKVPYGFIAPQNDSNIVKACLNLSAARLYLMQLALFDRSPGEDQAAWIEELTLLPGGATGKDSPACDDLISFWRTTDIPPAEQWKVAAREFYRAWIVASVTERLDRFISAYEGGAHGGQSALIASRMTLIDFYRSRAAELQAVLQPSSGMP